MTRFDHPRAPLVIALTATALASVGVALATSSTSTPPALPTDRPVKATVTSVPAAIGDHFSLMRRAREPGDTPTQGAQPGQFEPHGASLALARRPDLQTPDPIFVVPGNGDMCLVYAYDDASVCTTVAEAEQGYLLSYAPCLPGLKPGEVGITGVVPDGVNTVHLDLTDGSSLSARPHDNAYHMVSPGVSARPVDVKVALPGGGQTTVATPIDPGELPSTCDG